MAWSDNQHTIINDLVKVLDATRSQKFVWVVLETRQSSIADSAIITMPLDGRSIVSWLRKKAVHVVYDGSAQYFRFTDDGPQKAAPWTSYT